MKSIAALLTEFGTEDWYVGSMKGVMLGIDPSIHIVDITHHIPAGDIAAGAFALVSAFGAFPPGTVFVAVVDPGVGSGRRGIAAGAGGHFFVGPDNGLFSLVFRRVGSPTVHVITDERYMLPGVSSTFHGRDVFAPVAAHLCADRALKRFGPPAGDLVALEWPEPLEEEGRIRGQIVHIDAFGNAVTAIEASRLERFDRERVWVRYCASRSIPLRRYYQEAARGEALALVGSSGFLEISVNRGNAARELGLRKGDEVEISQRRSRAGEDLE